MISICRQIFSLIFRSNYDDLIKILKVVFFVFLSLSMLLNFSVSLIYHTFPLCPANFFPYFGQDGNINGVHHGWAVTSASPGSLIYLPVINELIQTSLRVLIWLRGVVSWKKVLPMKLLTIRSVDHSRSHSPLFCSFSHHVCLTHLAFTPDFLYVTFISPHLLIPPLSLAALLEIPQSVAVQQEHQELQKQCLGHTGEGKARHWQLAYHIRRLWCTHVCMCMCVCVRLHVCECMHVCTIIRALLPVSHKAAAAQGPQIRGLHCTGCP